MSAATFHAYGRNVSAAAVRAVWLAVSHDDGATIAELSSRLPLSRSTIVRALKALGDAGFIAQEPRKSARTRKVLFRYMEVSR